MSDTGVRQRLAAILAADVAGYSRLMAADERATVAALDAARVVIRRQIEANQGRVIDMAGDSVLAVFETAAGAVTAALAVQQELRVSLGEVPEDRCMRFRIGVHLGDVIEKADGTVYGDGVNIAARLQGLAKPGGITVSDSIRNAVRGKVGASFVDQGEQQVKNIAHPVRAFRVRTQGTGIPERAESSIHSTRQVQLESKHSIVVAGSVVLLFVAIASAWLWSSRNQTAEKIPPTAVSKAVDSKSIAVLPFTNMSEDKDTAYFADGVHEDLLTQLALLGELRVVSRTSVMDYRDTKKNIRQIGTELGVGTLVEGSVRRAGNQVRVTAQLIDASSDKHLWGKNYDRELKDIFAIQSELAIEIARALKVTLSPRAETQITTRPTSSLEAYDVFLRAQELFNQSQGTIREWASLKDRIALLSKAVELDPQFAHAWARLATEHARAYYSATDKTPARQTQAKLAMDRALGLAPEDLVVRIAEGDYYRMALADYERAAQAFAKVLQAAPHNVDALNGLASVYLYQDRAAERVALIERALTVEPRSFGALKGLKFHYVIYRHYDRALAYQQKLIDLRPNDISLQAERQRIEYLRTGTWDAYDTWRSRLPERAEGKFLMVRNMDVDRAIARRDYAEVLRLAEVDSEDSRDSVDSSQAGILKHRLLALTHRARGDRVRAIESARMGMRLLEAETKNRPRDWYSWQLKSWLHAVLGERGAALATHERAVAVAKKEGGAIDEESSRRGLLGLHALLGNRREAVAEASRQLKLPDSHPNEMRLSLELADLWDDSQFQAILNDPSNISPLPFNTKYSQVPLR